MSESKSVIDLLKANELLPKNGRWGIEREEKENYKCEWDMWEVMDVFTLLIVVILHGGACLIYNLNICNIFQVNYTSVGLPG